MPYPTLPLLSLLSLISLLSLSSSTSTPQTTTVTLSLSSTAPPPHFNQWQKLNHLATSSATRAHHLKHPNTTTTPDSTKVPLFPRGYGGYSVNLSFGTPPQTLPFVMDTGSSLVWFPCTPRYSCNSCNFVGVENIPAFLPRSSSTTNIVGCKNPKCKWIFPNVECTDCNENSTTGCNESCPPYIIEYGSGSTTGLLLSESLTFSEKTVSNFVVGCSVFSSRQPSGIVGFGRGAESLPKQMGLSKFSYCLVSHRFDDTPVSSDFTLFSGGDAAAVGGEIEHTPFRKISTMSNPAFQDYYYVTLRKITVGGVKVKIPYKILVPDSAGNGGTIIDSGTTFTFVENQAHELVAEELEKQVGQNYSRATAVEQQAGLRPCFNVTGQRTISLPQLTFHFKGGAQMDLPLANYFSFFEDSVICMTIVTSGGNGGGVGPGPAIILGNYQQQNFYIEYDLKNERLGFRKELCDKSG